GISSRNCSSVTAPARRITGRDPVQSTTVDSNPTSVGSAFSMQPIRPSRSVLTACHVVGLGFPDRFADGAATGNPQARKNWSAIGFLGIRTPTVINPAVTIEGTRSLFGRITVSGPGKNLLINFSAKDGISFATCSSWLMLEMWMISGLSEGRPLATKIRLIASALNAFAPNP